MTSLDDALNSSAPMFDQVSVSANWVELAPGYMAATEPVDNLTDLGQQIGPQGYTVKQSFDDGLPDPVTMTGSNDASGSFAMDLVGRPPNVADVFGWRAVSSGNGTAAGVTVPNPTFIKYGDYQVVTVTVPNLGDLTDVNFNMTDLHGWTLLATRDDTTVKVWVWGRPFFTGASGLTLTFGGGSSTYSWISVAFYAETYFGSVVNVRAIAANATGLSEASSTTGHTLPAQNIPSRGWALGVWATTPALSWTAGAGSTLVQTIAGLGMTISPHLPSGDNARTLTATSSSATSVVAALGIPLVIIDRPFMDAAAYFSPFNDASPVYGFDRDTAPMAASVNVVTATGVVGTPVFTGQMADITLSGRTADLTGVSATRINVDNAITLPTVFGNRESCTVDWLVSYLAAQGGQYAGVAPSIYTRLMVPMHGSIHAFNDGPLGYAAAFLWDVTRSPTGLYGQRPPKEIDGPFYSAMFFQQTDAMTQLMQYKPDRVIPPPPGIMDFQMNDILSQQNSEGRWSFWIRGDAAAVAAASLAGGNDDLLTFIMYNDLGPGVGSYLRLRISSDRQIRFTMDGTQVAMTGGVIPSDGNWHFVGINWDYVGRKVQGQMDSTFWDSPTGWGAAAALPVTDAAWRDAGHFMWHSYEARLPIAEMQLECGDGVAQVPFTRFWPTPLAPSMNMLTRPTHQWIEDVAEPTPVQGWTVLNELAQASSSWIRINEDDNLEFLPLGYFGETAQLTAEAVTIDTEVNAADLGVTFDPTLTRNNITVQFNEERADVNRASVLDIGAAIAIPRGITSVTFALDVPVAELHGASSPYLGTTWDITRLTAAQVAGSSPLPNEHFMSVNPLADGTGTVSVSVNVAARIIGWDNSTVTIQFTNRNSGTWYLANNGQSIPFLRILGYQIRKAVAYTTTIDPGSVGKRRERALTSEMSWVTRRDVAAELAGRLLDVLSRPRAQIIVRVMGNPLRRPGQLVNLLDNQGTKADGTWRIVSITANGNGPQYTQDLQLLFVPDVLIWDQGTWDNFVWGA